ncbi:hypothetical protein EVAR_49304_1 [Eumeta japonica]|uniref:Uncharacterized protein n=1 Tax=Eumeta variegata TaxID=151549 RepID=A0A4C1XQM7_EUMVA|nr:hypothetical protein EVAR_49304_1 [Eumeta japonica]
MATPRAREPAGRKPRASGERALDNSNSVFSGLSNDIQNDLIKSIAQVIRDEIKSEINFAKFVSVIADETPDISHREQISVIFRYLTKTGIEERFVVWNSASKIFRFILILNVLSFRRTARLGEIFIERGPVVEQKFIPSLLVLQSMKKATGPSLSP